MLTDAERETLGREFWRANDAYRQGETTSEGFVAEMVAAVERILTEATMAARVRALADEWEEVDGEPANEHALTVMTVMNRCGRELRARVL